MSVCAGAPPRWRSSRLDGRASSTAAGRGGIGVRFEMFVYVDDVDEAISSLRAQGMTILREAADMPWGERLAYVADPEGNPVALARPVN